MNTFDYFRKICEIPRESGNEEGMRQFILSWARENNFEAVRDKTGNIIVYRDADPGYEDLPLVALQGHMDMVCVKTADSTHDFKKDPIEVYKDGDRLRAKDTSLGGDNGIAVAMIMALFTDETARHGKLEAVFTYNEEIGMDGAFGLETQYIKSRKLINIDSEEEGIIYIGCAGGTDFKATKKLETETCPSDYVSLSVKVWGLLGGHSGGEIHLQRANAISVLVRMVYKAIESKYDIRIADMKGGVRRNVIPSSAECIVSIPNKYKEQIIKVFNDEYEAIKNEYKLQDSGLSAEFISIANNPEKVLSSKDTKTILGALFACPHGVYAQSFAVPGVVETSNNLAICKIENNEFNVEVSIRSLVLSARDNLANRIKLIFDSFGFETWIGNDYPSWEPDPNSELAKHCARVWKEQTGKDAVLTSIHAGLECGVINSKIPGMDSVSIGPDLKDVHSVNESLSISSTNLLYSFLKNLLSSVK